MKKKINLIEILLLLYFCLGMLKGINIFKYLDYCISLIIQLIVWYDIIKSANKVANKQAVIIYMLLMIEIAILIINFLCFDVPIIKIVNRILPLISVFGLIIVDCIKTVNIEKVIRYTKKFYFILGCVLILNSISYFAFSKAIWRPSIYLGYRFSGPFYDCNFLSICYSVMLILELFDKEHIIKQRYMYLIVFAICILLGLSWSAIFITLVALIFGNMFKGNKIILKQIFLLLIYFLVIVIINFNNIKIQDEFCGILEKYTSLTETEAIVKYNSFYYRVNAQIKALKLFCKKPLGYGPLQIVNFIGMDVHNSYVSFIFEMGIIGFLIQITSCLVKKQLSNRDNVLCFYILLISFTINIHYSVLYALLLIILFNNKSEELENKSEKKENIICK